MNRTLASLWGVLRRRGNRLGLVGLSLAAFGLYLFLPVWTIPGNTLRFQLSIFLTRDWVLMGLLAVLTGLLLVLQVDLFRRHKGLRARLAVVGKGGAGSVAGLLAAVLGTAACSSCVAAVLGFLGVGTVLGLIQYRRWVVLGASIVMLVAIHLTLRHAAGRCPDCESNQSKRG